MAYVKSSVKILNEIRKIIECLKSKPQDVDYVKIVNELSLRTFSTKSQVEKVLNSVIQAGELIEIRLLCLNQLKQDSSIDDDFKKVFG